MNRKIAKVITKALVLVLVFSMLASLASCGLFADKPQYDLFDEKNLLPVENEDGEWGYINKKGKEVIKCEYDAALPFTEGLAAVCDDGEWGYINTKGKEIIKCEYDEANPFDKKGHAIVCDDGDYGVINKKGEFVIKAKYDDIEVFNEFDLAIAKKDGLYGVIDRKGEKVVDFDYIRINEFKDDGYAVVQNAEGLCGVVDKKGETVIKEKYASISAAGDDLFAKNGLVLAKNEKGKYGFLDKKGEKKIDFDFDYAYSFADNGLAAVGEAIDVEDIDDILDMVEEAEWGFIDKSGDYVIKPEFEAVKSFAKNGLAAVCEDGEWGYIKKNGKFAIDPEFDTAYSFDDEQNLAIVGEDDKDGNTKYGVINKSGKLVVDTDYEDIEILKTCIIAEDDDSDVLFSLSGKEIESYDSISQATYEGDYLIATDEDENALITSKGKIKIDFTDDFEIGMVTDDGYVMARDDEGVYIFLKMNGKEAFETEEEYHSCMPYAYVDMYFNEDLYY